MGIRFTGLAIPQEATIIKATVQFQADETSSEATSLTIEGEATDNAVTFRSSNGNISSRNRTSAAVAWAPAPWSTKGEAGLALHPGNCLAVTLERVLYHR